MNPITSFETHIIYGGLTGKFVIDRFHEPYLKVAPSLHRHCGNPEVVDVPALLYACKRLPDTIHQVREILVQADVPDKLPGMAGIEEIRTEARRRPTFMIGEDIIIIVAREGHTELLDLACLLTMWSIEAQKITALMKETPLLADLQAYLTEAPELAEENRLLARLAFQLGTTDDLVVELNNLWQGTLLARVRHLAEHPTHLTMRLHRGYSVDAAIERSRQWARAIKTQVAATTGPVHILSSNLHSAVNLLSAFPRKIGPLLTDWAGTRYGEGISSPDLLYYALKDWMAEDAARAHERRRLDETLGLRSLPDEFRVGLNAQILELALIDPAQTDPRLQVDWARIQSEKPILLNFDYAFGEQAGIVLEQLLREFGPRVASVSIMGKAGSLVGSRGGILLPSYLLRQGSNDLYDLPFPNVLVPEDFEGLEVRSGGPMLTVMGTVLQNDAVLSRYRDEWGCLGLEMEGIPYLRALHQCRKLGLTRPDLKLGIGYYASDTPLVAGQSLAKELALEGVKATYALNLALFNRLL